MSRLLPSALLGGLLLTASAVASAQAAVSSDQAPPVTTTAPPGPDQPTAPPVAIDGFRSAHFGMTEAELRKAIETDFKLTGSAVKPSENPVERTRVLSVTVADLVPDSGKAIIDYVFGFKSKRLIDVRVTWSVASDPANKPEALVRTGLTLQGYFQTEGFPAGQTVANGMLPDGSLVIFRGTDAEGHVVNLVLTGPVRQDTKEHKAQMTPTVLSLVYAADIAHPDVFRLQRGAF